MIRNRERSPSSPRELNMFPPPQNKALHHLSFICTVPRWFLSACVFIIGRWPLNLHCISLCTHPGPPLSLSVVWHVRTSCLVVARIDVKRRCVLIQGPAYLPAVFSGLCRGAASQQDDPSYWPHTPEPCLVLTALEVGFLPVCGHWTKSLCIKS